MNEPMIALDDYRSSMQQAALCFLQNHEAEHLSGDSQLADRAVQHLIHILDVPVFMAAKCVQAALNQLQSTSKVQRVAVTAKVNSLCVMITDSLTGEVVSIPRRILPEHFLAAACSHANPNH
ncbi:hypothetical protein [Pseudomonas sp.]|uniref:hypothetical protein n=1 Tax=Pseudomonas sp. TaxID=306 RepID=UPI0025800D3C|nr:hypothetical protein [Pseudomonas sp.]